MPGSNLLDKAFALLGAFTDERPELTLTELAAATALAPSTAHRVAYELVRLGALERSDGRFRPGRRLFELGQLVPGHRALRDAALPFLEDLYEVTHETVHLAVLDGADVVYVEKISGHRRTAVPSRVGGRVPAHGTGVGKALLAFLPRATVERILPATLPALTPATFTDRDALVAELAEVRQRHVAFDREEAQAGVTCVASPVLDGARLAVAALSVTGPVGRFDPVAVAPAVRAASLGIARRLASG